METNVERDNVQMKRLDACDADVMMMMMIGKIFRTEFNLSLYSMLRNCKKLQGVILLILRPSASTPLSPPHGNPLSSHMAAVTVRYGRMVVEAAT